MNAFVERLGWMLLHSVWEGVVVWLLLQIALITLQNKSAQARYLAACFALVLMALLPWVTFGSMDLSARLRSAPSDSVPSLVQSENVSAVPDATVSSNEDSNYHAMGSIGSLKLPESQTIADAFMPWLVIAWGIGVSVFTLRLWMSWRSVRQLAQMPLPGLSVVWQCRLAELCQTAGDSLPRSRGRNNSGDRSCSGGLA